MDMSHQRLLLGLLKAIHKMSPSVARKQEVKLNLFPRISCVITLRGENEIDYQTRSNNEQTVNLSGFQWEIMKSPNLKPIDTCYYLASKWQESNRTNLLELGAGLGQNAIYFAKQGFNASAMDISEYAMEDLKELLAYFDVELIKQTEYYFNFQNKRRREKFYYINAMLRNK